MFKAKSTDAQRLDSKDIKGVDIIFEIHYDPLKNNSDFHGISIGFPWDFYGVTNPPNPNTIQHGLGTAKSTTVGWRMITGSPCHTSHSW